jgi:predicted Fe-S protein YdhL (DUF1289 family)
MNGLSNQGGKAGPVTIATQLRAKAQAIPTLEGPVPSPCISLCRMDPNTELCIGCYRTLDEIMVWSRATDIDKKAVWQRIEHRLTEAPT